MPFPLHSSWSACMLRCSSQTAMIGPRLYHCSELIGQPLTPIPTARSCSPRSRPNARPHSFSMPSALASRRSTPAPSSSNRAGMPLMMVLVKISRRRRFEWVLVSLPMCSTVTRMMWRVMRRFGVMCIGTWWRAPTHRVNLMRSMSTVAFACRGSVLATRLLRVPVRLWSGIECRRLPCKATVERLAALAFTSLCSCP